jgi:glycosyltransferase involved in cell wall biosynthesis
MRLSLASAGERSLRSANHLAHHTFVAAASVALARLRPEIIVPLIMDPELSYVRFLRRALGARLISVGHGTAGNDAAAVCGVDAFVATSPRQAEWARYFCAAHVELIPIGVDVARFSSVGPRAQIALPRPVFVQVGSLIPVKRAPLSVAAVEALGRGSLLVIGEGSGAGELDEMARRRLGLERYQRIPRLSHDRLAEHYRAANALLFPSAAGETAGLVTLEALGCGIPVVAAEDANRRWLIGDVATLVDPTRADAFAKGIEEALATADPSRNRRHAEHFAWSAIAARHTSLYERFARAARAPISPA